MWKINNISIKGIVGGIGFDILASVLLSIIVAVVFSTSSGISIENQNEYQQAFEASLNVRLTFLIGGLLIALGMGFIAEKLSSNLTLINAGICGATLLLFNVIMVTINPEGTPIWSQIVIIVGVLPLSVFGGWLVVKNKNT